MKTLIASHSPGGHGECPFCKIETTKTLRRGDLVLETEPPAVFWKGSQIEVTPSEFRLLSLLVRRGSVPWCILEDVIPLSADAGPRVVSVTLSRVRRKLREADAAAKNLIQPVRGWGLRLAEA